MRNNKSRFSAEFFSPRAAVKSALLLFHTWGFVSLAVQSASRTHFSRGVPPNCFLAVPARLEESDLRAGAARTLCVHAHTTCVLAGQVHPKKILGGSRAGRQIRYCDSF